jgi:hypothetical protein
MFVKNVISKSFYGGLTAVVTLIFWFFYVFRMLRLRLQSAINRIISLGKQKRTSSPSMLSFRFQTLRKIKCVLAFLLKGVPQ